MLQTIDINDLATIGVIKDQHPHQLPPEAWSLAQNVRYRDDFVERLLGWTQIFGTPGTAPHFALPLSTAVQAFWLYVSLTKGYVWDGTNHTNITRQTLGVDVNYTASETRNWNGTILGGIPILNNGADVPQMWTPPVITTKLADLTNWPSTQRARVVRALGPILNAYNVTDSGTNKPHLVRWSHPADPGSVPSSWDITDPTKDAGEVDLPDVNSGQIMDALPLQGNMYIYKEGSVWRQTPSGGTDIFDFKTFLETAGILGPRCVTLTGDGLFHVVLTQDDVLIHNGNSADSILAKKMKKTLFNAIDATHYLNCFLFTNPIYDEVWICYPSDGNTNPNSALIWNYRTGKMGALSEADGITFRNAMVGQIESPTSGTWASDSGAWEDDTTLWSNLERRRMLLCGTDATKFYKMDDGITRDGTSFTGTVQRTGLSILGRKRGGEWIVDHEIRKLVTRIWPKVREGSVKIRVGFQDLVDGPTTWKPYVTFDPLMGTLSPADGVTADTSGSGRAVSIEITDADTKGVWDLEGYKVELAKTGRF